MGNQSPDSQTWEASCCGEQETSFFFALAQIETILAAVPALTRQRRWQMTNDQAPITKQAPMTNRANVRNAKRRRFEHFCLVL
jgi:hypothetical protein